MLRGSASCGLGGALPTPRGEPRFGVDRAPLGPVVAPLVPRCALLPAPTPRLMGLRPPCTFHIPKRSAWRGSLPRIARRGGSPREGARSEERAEQRLAAGGRRLPRPGTRDWRQYAISYWLPDMPTARSAAPTNKHERAYRLIRE